MAYNDPVKTKHYVARVVITEVTTTTISSSASSTKNDRDTEEIFSQTFKADDLDTLTKKLNLHFQVLTG